MKIVISGKEFGKTAFRRSDRVLRRRFQVLAIDVDPPPNPPQLIPHDQALVVSKEGRSVALFFGDVGRAQERWLMIMTKY